MFFSDQGGFLRFFLLLALSVAPSLAGNFSFNGNFSQDDDLHYFTVQLNAPGDFSIRTNSYAGGGFDPVISVFDGVDPASMLIGLNNDGGCLAVGQDPNTGACWDSLLSFTAMPAGFYLVVLSQSDNTPFGPTLGDGFNRTGQGNFTGLAFLGSPGSFIDSNPSQRTSEWSLDILNVDFATDVPEPATALLFTAALVALGAGHRCSRRN